MSMQAHFMSPEHDHSACRQRALSEAAEVCFRNGERMTENRLRVFEQILSSHRPQKAADITDALSEDGPKSISPMMVYRALDFLVEQGLIHKISTLNAYIGCVSPLSEQGHCFLICTACGTVTDWHDTSMVDEVRSHAEAAGFLPAAPVIEIQGLCPYCQNVSARSKKESTQ